MSETHFRSFSSVEVHGRNHLSTCSLPQTDFLQYQTYHLDFSRVLWLQDVLRDRHQIQYARPSCPYTHPPHLFLRGHCTYSSGPSVFDRPAGNTHCVLDSNRLSLRPIIPQSPRRNDFLRFEQKNPGKVYQWSRGCGILDSMACSMACS